MTDDGVAPAGERVDDRGQSDADDGVADNAPSSDTERVIVSTDNEASTYHVEADCPAVKVAGETTAKPLSVLRDHYDACTRCVDVVFIASERAHRRRYHRNRECRYVAASDNPRRRPLSLLDGCQPCTHCAASDADPDREIITACPECDAAGIQPVHGGISGQAAHDYRCKSCSATFDEPAERPRKTGDGGRAGLAGKLMEADPEDVSAEHVDGGPMTDGGERRWD